jgi:hypothetical protein
MDTIIREPVDGWLIRMNDEVGKMAVPGSLFRFGRTSFGRNLPLVETYQPGWAVGTQHLMPFNSEDGLRQFLLGLGFTERERVTNDAPRWTMESQP